MIAIGCDHAAYDYKLHIIEYLKSKGLEVLDLGTDSSTDSVDYPDFAAEVAKAIVSGKCREGILICGTGIGMSIAANKIRGIRCAHCTDTFSARAAKEHNNANILALGARITGLGLMTDIVDTFLSSKFTDSGRHQKRIDKISQLEEK